MIARKVIVSVYRILRITPMPRSVHLRIRRAAMDFDYKLDCHQRTKTNGREEDGLEDEEWSQKYQILEDDEAQFHSKQLLIRARKLRIPVPSVWVENQLSFDYQHSAFGGLFLLSITGEQKVRAAIREEEKYQSERWARRIPYITALSGLIGTITGLVALLIKSGH